MDEAPPAVAEFTSAAREFCTTIEAVGEDSDWLQLTRSLVPLLGELVAGAYRLPDVAPITSDPIDLVTHADWGRRFSTLSTALGPHDAYWTVFDPSVTDAAEPTLGSLADDLADTWRDLANGLVALDQGIRWEDVTWQWRFGFDSHWGQHAVDSLRALHALTT